MFVAELGISVFSHWKEELGVLIQAVVALTLGGLLGWERESAGKEAGFRTHMLVCLAAMLFVKLGQFLISDSAHYYKPDAVRADPIHIIGAIATGISFLGAGTIFRDSRHDKQKGLTTAASLLCTGSLGVAIAIDRYIIAVGVTVIALFVLRIMSGVIQKTEAQKTESRPEA